MISQAFAKSFVAKVYRQLSINVNIMNEKGIIIASSSPERVGTFHAAAYDMLQRRIPMIITDDMEHPLIGVIPPGLNLLLTEGSEPIGVVGVRGDPEALLPIAKMIKFAIESMLDFQDSTKFAFSNDSTENKLTQALFFETPQNAARIKKLAENRGARDGIARIAVMICVQSSYDSGVIISTLSAIYRQISCYDEQDILLLVDNQHAMLLKALPEQNSVVFEPYIDTCSHEISQTVAAHIGEAKAHELVIKYYCGMPQNSIQACGQIYAGLLWLRKYNPHTTKSTVYLRDYLLEYMVEHAPSDQLDPILRSYCDNIGNVIDAEMFKETGKALIASHMRPQAAAQMLFMHKNTIMSRLNKVRERIGIHPLTDVKDAVFFIILYHYLINDEKLQTLSL